MSKRFAICDEAGKVVNVILMDDGAYPTNWYPGYGRYLVALETVQWPTEPIHPTKMTFNPVQVKDRCGPGDTIDLKTGVVTPLTPPVPPPPSRDELREYAANKRWEIEIGGAPWGQHVVQTDREAQTKLIAEFVAMGAGLRADPSPWKMRGGNFLMLTNAQMAEVIMTVRTHVATAFATEANVLESIEDNLITTFAQVDQASWPLNGGKA